MRLLIDSQSLIWYVDQDHLLTPAAHVGITDPNNDLLLSAATIWEIAIKVGLKNIGREGQVLQYNIPLYSKDLGVRLAMVAFSRPIYLTG
jgi:PIN domain nuclease of toxin-antitoxin system